MLDMTPTMPMVADPIFAPVGFDWGVGGWLFVMLAVLLVPCVPILLKAAVELLNVSARPVRRRRPALIAVRRPVLKSS